MLPHRLVVRFMRPGDDSGRPCTTREYNLDDIKAHPAVTLRPDRSKRLMGLKGKEGETSNEVGVPLGALRGPRACMRLHVVADGSCCSYVHWI